MSFRRKFGYLSDPPVANTPYGFEIDEDRCTGCGLCVRQCPCQTVALVERSFSKKQQPACQAHCPAGIDIRSYLQLLAGGAPVEQAWGVLVDANPFPSVTGRVCTHPCESVCNRIELDGSVNIHELERWVGDQAIEKKLGFEKPRCRREEKVAVVGAGPAGLSCAYQLARLGYQVTVFERDPLPGGMLRYAIPEYRLPSRVVDSEIKRILDLGVSLRCNAAVGREISLGQLRAQYRAVYLAVGAQRAAGLGLQAGQGTHCLTGLDFLRKIRQGERPVLGQRTAVIGGGNTALDAARVARRMGGEVTILYRRSREEMPASPAEVEEAVAEGIYIRYLCAPTGMVRDAGRNTTRLTCVKTELGSPDQSGRGRPIPVEGSEFELEIDTVISAVGQLADSAGLEPVFDARGRIAADDRGRTGDPAVFAGGDAVLGPATVGEAIGAGRRAALSMDAYFQSRQPPAEDRLTISYRGMPLAGYGAAERNRAPRLEVEQRLADPDGEVTGVLGQEQAAAESRRCLLCGRYRSVFTRVNDYFAEVCLACHNCEAVCPQDALRFPRYYRVEKGRWTTEHRCPEPGRGFPNPFGQEDPPSFDEIAPRLTEVERTIYTRRSNRIFESRQVPRELVHRVLEAGRFAPSAGNGMPWQFLVIRDRALLDQVAGDCRAFLSRITKLYQGRDPIRKPIKDGMALFMPGSIDQRPMLAIQAMLTPKFGEGHLDMFYGARTVIFVLSNRLGISSPALDAGICCQNMVLTAQALGLATCYVGFAAEPVNRLGFLRKKLGLSWPFDQVATTIALGYPAARLQRAVDREFPLVRWIEPDAKT